MEKLQTYLNSLELEIQKAHEFSPTLDEAEKLAALFLGAQIKIGTELSGFDLDARMRKSGVKAIKAAVYLQEATRQEKKPTEAMLTALIDMDKTVAEAQDAFDTAEVFKNKLENWLSVCKDAHIFFRGLARGRFE